MKTFRFGSAWDVAAGGALLILVYLLLAKGNIVNDLIRVSGTQIRAGVRTFQGR